MENAMNCLGKALQTATADHYTGKAIMDHIDLILTITDELID